MEDYSKQLTTMVEDLEEGLGTLTCIVDTSQRTESVWWLAMVLVHGSHGFMTWRV